MSLLNDWAEEEGISFVSPEYMIACEAFNLALNKAKEITASASLTASTSSELATILQKEFEGLKEE